MEVIDYLKLAQKHTKKSLKNSGSVSIAIVTNFTDDLLKKIMTGLCIEQNINPDIYTVPYKQYLFELKNKKSKLWKNNYDLVYIFFDINVYIKSEFISTKKHIDEVLRDLENICSTKNNTFVIQTAITPSSIQHGRLLKNNDVYKIIENYNNGLKKISQKLKNVHIVNTDNIHHLMGEHSVRDMRGLYAFSQPFTSDFLLKISKEWIAFLKSQKGKIYKCIVLDLDNTLWGGVLGEMGPLGIKLGTEYPGNAFSEFQKTILDFYNNGIILAINSRNNKEDVNEVFQKNPNMLLQKNHFASIVANWNNKAENLKIIAKELNIGLDSMVFIDDDPMNRDLVRQELPEVFVPEWSIPPEEYTRKLLNIDSFHSMGLTEEDKQRGKMYVAERERKEVEEESSNLGEYLKTLNVEIDLYINNKSQVARLSQITQKTNQFNLTTKRMTENEVENFINRGNLVFSGDVKDKFGPYGITILAFIEINKKEAILSNFLMSCRIMGRRVEEVFMNSILEELSKKNIPKMEAYFVPTIKNKPSKNFLKDIGGKEKQKTKSKITYTINTGLKNKEKIPIKINKLI